MDQTNPDPKPVAVSPASLPPMRRMADGSEWTPEKSQAWRDALAEAFVKALNRGAIEGRLTP